MGPLSVSPTAHLDDGAIVRLIDGALPMPDRDRAAAHAASCDVCGTRLAIVRRRSDVLSAMLRSIDGIDRLPTSAPVSRPATSGRVSGRWRAHAWGRHAGKAAAAATLVTITAAVIVSPLGAWITREVRRLVPPPAPEAAAVARPEAPTPRSIAVSFTPDTGEILFWLDAQPAGGGLELRLRDAEALPVAEVFGGRSTEEVVVMPNGIRIHNDSASDAVYRLTVPDRRIRVRVRIGDRGTDTVLTVTEAGSRLDLRPGGGKR